MIRYRPHRGSLADAMAEEKTFKTVNEMFRYIVGDWSRYDKPFGKRDLSIDKDYSKDHRINWKESRYVCTKRMGKEEYAIPQCIGMCSIESINIFDLKLLWMIIRGKIDIDLSGIV